VPALRRSAGRPYGAAMSMFIYVVTFVIVVHSTFSASQILMSD
jgi:hypothetical protein